jgi:hypothetical protein
MQSVIRRFEAPSIPRTSRPSSPASRKGREYFDEGLALLQLGFAPEALAKVLRRRR